MMIVILPASLLGQDSGRAMLRTDGGAWLNGNPAPASSAIFPHDVVQTQKEHTAKIDAEGSTATVRPDTIVQFEGDELVLDHGSLQVNTSRGMKVRVNCLTVIPVTQEWTRYDVTDVDGKATVAAYQNDVKIHYQGAAVRKSQPAGASDVIVHQGEQVTREERCGAAARPADVIDAKGAILNSVWAKGAGLAVIGVLTCWALCRSGNPISPDTP
jgi:ribosomal protein L32E